MNALAHIFIGLSLTSFCLGCSQAERVIEPSNVKTKKVVRDRSEGISYDYISTDYEVAAKGGVVIITLNESNDEKYMLKANAFSYTKNEEYTVLISGLKSNYDKYHHWGYPSRYLESDIAEDWYKIQCDTNPVQYIVTIHPNKSGMRRMLFVELLLTNVETDNFHVFREYYIRQKAK